MVGLERQIQYRSRMSQYNAPESSCDRLGELPSAFTIDGTKNARPKSVVPGDYGHQTLAHRFAPRHLPLKNTIGEMIHRWGARHAFTASLNLNTSSCSSNVPSWASMSVTASFSSAVRNLARWGARGRIKRDAAPHRTVRMPSCAASQRSLTRRRDARG